MLGTIVFVANVYAHGVQVKDKFDNVFLDHQPTLIDLCDVSNEDATFPISIHPFNFSLLNSIIYNVPLQPNPKVVIFGPSFLSVVDCLKLMPFAPHAPLN
jgi:hypothetical protein